MRAATQAKAEAEVAATDSAAISIKTLKCKWSKCCNKVQALLHTHSFTHTDTHSHAQLVDRQRKWRDRIATCGKV